MTEKSEEQIAKERDAVAAMRNAQANMSSALERISTLESALTYAISNLQKAKTYISSHVYAFPISGKSESVHAEIDRYIATAQAKLGKS